MTSHPYVRALRMAGAMLFCSLVLLALFPPVIWRDVYDDGAAGNSYFNSEKVGEPIEYRLPHFGHDFLFGPSLKKTHEFGDSYVYQSRSFRLTELMLRYVVAFSLSGLIFCLSFQKQDDSGS